MKEINKIIQAYDDLDWSKEKAALATVVRVEESAYRRIGARMMVTGKGIWTGGISGGCLEGDALKRAQMAIGRERSSIVVYDTLQEDAHQIGIGLGCNGRIDVLFTPIDPEDGNNPVELLKKVRNRREPVILFQIIAVHQGDPQALGLMATEDHSSTFAASIGLNPQELASFKVESKTQRKSLIRTVTGKDNAQYDLLIEFIRPRVKLVCIGDNYDVNAFVSIGHELNWEVHVAGKLRKLSKYVFEYAEKIHDYETIKELPLDAYTAVILMSHDYKVDFTLLKHYLYLDLPYLGLLGPKKRTLKMQAELRESHPDLDLSRYPNLFSPVGLDIGAEAPEEIALAIAGEIIAVMRQRPGSFLKDRPGPIHDR